METHKNSSCGWRGGKRSGRNEGKTGQKLGRFVQKSGQDKWKSPGRKCIIERGIRSWKWPKWAAAWGWGSSRRVEECMQLRIPSVTCSSLSLSHSSTFFLCFQYFSSHFSPFIAAAAVSALGSMQYNTALNVRENGECECARRGNKTATGRERKKGLQEGRGGSSTDSPPCCWTVETLVCRCKEYSQTRRGKHQNRSGKNQAERQIVVCSSWGPSCANLTEAASRKEESAWRLFRLKMMMTMKGCRKWRWVKRGLSREQRGEEWTVWAFPPFLWYSSYKLQNKFLISKLFILDKQIIWSIMIQWKSERGLLAENQRISRVDLLDTIHTVGLDWITFALDKSI